MSDYWTAPNGRAFKVVSATRADAALPRPSPAKASKAHRLIAKPLDGLPVASGTLSLSTVPPSVNSLFFNRARGKGRGRTLVYRNWRAAADAELRAQPSWHVPGKVAVKIVVGSARGDVDNRVKATLDLLVSAGRIEDDKHVSYVSAERDAIVGTRIIIVKPATP